MNFFKFFKRRYPYAPVAFLGRKNVQKMLGADIKKLKNIDKVSSEDEEAMTLEEKDIAKQAKKAVKAKDTAKQAKKINKAKDKDASKSAKKTTKAKDASKPAKKIAKAKDKDATKPAKKATKAKK